MKTKQRVSKHWRQGDLMILSIDSLPKSLKKRKNLIVLYGESTGHSHYLKSGSVYDGKNNTIYLELPRKSQLLHDSDHGPIDLPKGFYEVRRQVETTMGDMTRMVQD